MNAPTTSKGSIGFWVYSRMTGMVLYTRVLTLLVSLAISYTSILTQKNVRCLWYRLLSKTMLGNFLMFIHFSDVLLARKQDLFCLLVQGK